MAAWSVAAARSVASGVVLVVPADSPDDPTGPLASLGADRIVPGGATRSQSVRAGLATVPDEATIIVVHDAARPLAPASLFAAVVEAVRSPGVEGAIPVLAVTDTLTRVVGRPGGGTMGPGVDREALVTVQTPQAFVATALRAAHLQGGEATDDARLLEDRGATVRTVEGHPHNLKLTRPEDLILADALMGTTPR